MLRAMQGEIAQQWQASSDSGRLLITPQKRAAPQQKLDAGCDERCSQCRANHRARATQVRHSSARLRSEKSNALFAAVSHAPMDALSLREQGRRSHACLLICFLALLLIPLQEQAECVCNSPKPQGPPWPGAQDALLTIPRGSHDDQRVPSVAVIWQTWSRSNLQPLSSHLMRASRPLHHVQYLASF
jgi:hypothetical protein